MNKIPGFIVEVFSLNKPILQQNELLYIAQRDFLIDLIAYVFDDINKFRSWMDNKFGIANERFLTRSMAKKVVRGLQQMRARKYRIK